jgi:hypothetical protein
MKVRIPMQNLTKFIKNPVIYVKKLIIMLIQFKFGHFPAGKPVTQESSLDVFCHVIFDVNIDVMDVRGRTQEFVAL